MKVSSEIEKLVPYQPGKPIAETQREFGLEKVIKLASNENPLGPNPKVIQAIQKVAGELHRYPDPSFHDLIGAIANKFQVSRDQISIGNGSNEIIDLLIRIFCEPGEAILTTQSAFVAYQVCAQAARVQTLHAPLKDGYRMDLEKISAMLSEHSSKVRIVFIPNPNNPTGTIVTAAEIEQFLSKWGNDPNKLIVFDEAYTEYVRSPHYKSGLHYQKKYSNVVLIRTFSKAYGLAGLRVGYLVANPSIIGYFNRVRNPFNVNELAQYAAVAALQDDEYIRKSRETNWMGLDYFYSELRQMNLPFVESQANFVMFDTQQDAQGVFHKLLQQGVILRPIQSYGFKSHLRMSVGLMEENQTAIQALKVALSR